MLGLSQNEAKERLAKYGPNVLEGKKRTSALVVFFSQFKDFMVIILLLCMVVSALMGETVEAVAIVAIVILNAVMGFAQEYKTEKTMEALAELAAPTANVYRDGKLISIHASEIVPGDVVELSQGDRVPADGELTEIHSLTADESLLTGESLPVEKKKADKAFMGTMIRQGRGVLLVSETGMRTEMGKIAGLIDNSKETETPLQKRLAQLGKYIVAGSILICVIVSVLGIIRGEEILTMLVSGISLAVAAVPEGLPAIVTIALALGVQRMVKKNALARKLPAIETLGCAGVICSDKTGTLTENKMTVRKVYIAGAEDAVDVSVLKDRKSPIYDKLFRLTEIAVCCNNAQGETGDPTEVALIKMAEESGFDFSKNAIENIRIHEYPFDSERKCMSVVVKKPDGEKYIFTKGAPDVILKKCSNKHTFDSAFWANHAMCEKALRVLAFAYRRISNEEWAEFPRRDFENNLTFVGMTGMIDPPRPEVKPAVAVCRRAGIKICMITGDHKDTALAIAKELDIWRPDDGVLTGAEIDSMGEKEFERAVIKTTVYARVLPKHKLMIVKALKKAGYVCAMTGDGVNDAPAVKEADIGIAMGKAGTDVTREAAALVLMDDNFSSIVSAVEEGRVIYNNIRKFIRYLLSCNIGEVLTMLLAMIMGLPLPLVPIQVLWVNLATDGLPAIALGLEPAEKDVMDRRPRRSNENVFSEGLLGMIIIRGILIGLSTLTVFASLYYLSGDITRARTATFATLVFSQLVHVFECKSERRSLFEIPLFNNIYLVGAVLFSTAMILSVIYIPALHSIFKTTTLLPSDWYFIAGFALLGPCCNFINRIVKKIANFFRYSVFKRKKTEKDIQQ